MLYHAGPSSLVLFIFFDLRFEVKIRLNKAFRFFNFLQKRKGERLSWFAFSSRRGTFDRGWLCSPRIDTADFDFLHAVLALSDVSRVCLLLLTTVVAVDVFAVLMNWLKLAQVTNFRATWVTDPIRISREMKKRQFNFFTNFGWHNPKAGLKPILSFWWPEQIF